MNRIKKASHVLYKTLGHFRTLEYVGSNSTPARASYVSLVSSNVSHRHDNPEHVLPSLFVSW